MLAALLLACVPDSVQDENHTDQEASPTPGGVPAAGATPTARANPARGLWILAEGSVRVLDDPARIDPLLQRAERLGATDLFVQVYRGGRAFYRADESVERAPSVRPDGPDGLDLLLDAAHRRGLRVHAWVNVLSLSTRRDAKLIADLGPEVILVDPKGRSLLDYPNFEIPEPEGRYYRMGTPGLYLDPALPAVRERIVGTFEDLLPRYPGLDGLHLDYIRHPGVLPFVPGSRFGVGLDFGYGAKSREIYRTETGNPDPIEGMPAGEVRRASDWDDWRRDKVTLLVEEIAAAMRSIKADLVLSAAVIPYVDRAYLSLDQDWRGWLESGTLDRVMPMVYTLDDRLLRYQLETFAGWHQADRIWPGLGIWLFAAAPGRAVEQIEILRANHFTGELLFSDDALAESEALLEAIAQTRSKP